MKEKSTSHSCFTEKQTDWYAFYRIPKVLFTRQEFSGLCSEAKLLYGVLLDRVGLSRKNGWIDREGRAYVIFTLEEVMQLLQCANQKATRLMRQLEKFGLIEQNYRARGCPKRIYVKDFFTA